MVIFLLVFFFFFCETFFFLITFSVVYFSSHFLHFCILTFLFLSYFIYFPSPYFSVFLIFVCDDRIIFVLLNCLSSIHGKFSLLYLKFILIYLFFSFFYFIEQNANIRVHFAWKGLSILWKRITRPIMPDKHRQSKVFGTNSKVGPPDKKKKRDSSAVEKETGDLLEAIRLREKRDLSCRN